jgi:hypothetical protein
MMSHPKHPVHWYGVVLGGTEHYPNPDRGGSVVRGGR